MFFRVGSFLMGGGRSLPARVSAGRLSMRLSSVMTLSGVSSRTSAPTAVRPIAKISGEADAFLLEIAIKIVPLFR